MATRRSWWAVVACAALCSPSAMAGPILDARYAGAVTDVLDPFGVYAGVSLGDPVGGTFRYTNPPTTVFDFGSPLEYLFAVGPGTGMTTTVGPVGGRATGQLVVHVYDPAFGFSGFDIQFNDADASRLSTAGLPPGYTLTGFGAFVGAYSTDPTTSTFPNPPATLLPLSRYDAFGGPGGFLFVDIRDAGGNYVDSAFVGFSLTALERVPEPGTASAFAGCGLLAGAWVRRRRVRYASVVTLVALVLMPAAAPAQAIGVNFATGASNAPGGVGPFLLSSGEAAGVVPLTNWNNLTTVQGSYNNTYSNLKNSAGATTTADLTVTNADGRYSVGGPTTTPNERMMRGYVETGGGHTEFTFGQLRAAGFNRYDVYVYFDGDPTTGNRVGEYNVGSRTIYGRDADNFSGTFVEVPLTSTAALGANTPAGNYIRFTNLTADSFALNTLGVSGDQFRAPVNGIQIVAVAPEPGGLLAVAAAVVAAWVRRRGRPVW